MSKKTWLIYRIITSILFLHGTSSEEEASFKGARECTDEIRQKYCTLPSCRCSGSDIPGVNQTRANTPQFVFLTFDDAVTWANFPLYERILSGRENPNGHPITATFFVSHEYTNYSMLHELWRRGHEIALHSITHGSPTTYWTEPSEKLWYEEIVRQRDQIVKFAQIPKDDVKGMRAPFLQIGGDPMYKVLREGKLEWECSRPTIDFRKPGLWPYTNDFRSVQECVVSPCPVNTHLGFWTVPMISMVGDNGEHCSLVDMCKPVPSSEKSTFSLLMRNFQDHYRGNRAPFGIFMHSAWLHFPGDQGTEERFKGYIHFLDFLHSLEDVYIVSISRALEWIKRPSPLEEIKYFQPFQVTLKDSHCQKSTNCRFGPEQTPFETEAERWMHSCVSTCPHIYPWIGNPLGDE